MRNTKHSKFIPCYDLPIQIKIQHDDKEIECDKNGELFLISTSSPSTKISNNRCSTWIIFPDMIINDVVVLKSKSFNYYLSSNEYGQVITTSGNIKSSEKEIEFDKWSIQKTREGLFTFTSHLHNRQLCCDGEYLYTFEEVLKEKQDCSTTQVLKFNIEFLNGELCYIYSPELNQRIKCNNLTGQVSLTNNYEGWEVWRFIEANDQDSVYISSWCHKDFYLSSNEYGQVLTSEKKEDTEKWIVLKDAEMGRNGILIQSLKTRRYLHAMEDGTLITLHSFHEETAIWQCHEGHQNRFFLSSVSHDKRVSIKKNLPTTSLNRRSFEIWQIEFFHHQGFCTLYSSSHNVYLGSDSNGNVFLDSNANDFQKWSLQETSFGEYFIVSCVHKQFLACNEKGELHTSNHYNESEMWFLEPCMPKKVTQETLMKLGIATGVGIAATFAMPLAVVGMVRGIGFGASGIVSGSTAAGMMSTAAVDGMVASGSTIAIMQSIGATGVLGAAGTSAAMLGGGIVGSGIVGATAKGTGVLDDVSTQEDVSPNENVLSSTNRPFCSWKMW